MSSLTINCIGFDWASVRHGGLVVDVGCGLGHVSLEIAKVRPDLHIVLEDRSTVINEAKNVCALLLLLLIKFPFFSLRLIYFQQYWNMNLASHVSENKVHFLREYDCIKPYF